MKIGFLFNALAMMLILPSLVMANNTSINISEGVDIINAKMALDPFLKTSFTFAPVQDLAEPYMLEATLTKDGTTLSLGIRQDALDNPLIVGEAIALVRTLTSKHLQSIMPGMMGKNPEEVVKLQTKGNQLSVALENFYAKNGIPGFTTNLIRNPIILAEVLTNAKQGSALAKNHLLEFERSAVSAFLQHVSEQSFIKQMTSEDLQKAIQDYALLKRLPPTEASFDGLLTAMEASYAQKLQVTTAQAVQEERQREKNFRSPKNTEVRNNARLNHKLDEMVKANDREGVARLFEAMVPWELMEFSEKQAWQTWIEAVRRPSKDKITLYRGLDKYDRPIGYDGTKAGFFSVMITRNQGSYSDRLRSLVKSRAENGRDNPVLQKDKKSSVTISQMFFRHSGQPVASPFLSFTRDADVARIFSEQGFLAVEMDRRRAIFNITSFLASNESEFLVPLVIFPDEVKAYIQETNLGTMDSSTFQELLKTKYQMKVPTTYDEISNKGRNFSAAYDFFAQIMPATSDATNSCSRLFRK